MASFYTTDDCKEIFAEKISVKLLQKFNNDGFEMFISDLAKVTLRNVALLLQSANVTITICDSDYTTLYRVNSYTYSNGQKTIGFTDSCYADCGRIDTESHYSGKVQTTFVPVTIAEAMPLFKEIVTQLLSA
jgi:hypothetical protein